MKNDRVGKRQRKVSVQKRRQQLFRQLKKWQSENGHLFTSRCHTDDAAAGLCYAGLPENHTLPKTTF